MEPVGFAVGVVGLAGLFNTCIECFKYIDIGKQYEHDSEVLIAKLQIQQTRLNIWGDLVGLGGHDESRRLNILDKQEAGVKLCLQGIRKLLTDSVDLIAKYGLVQNESSGHGSTSTGVRVPPSSNEKLRVYLEDLLPEQSTVTGSSKVSRAKWAVRDRERFQNLVTDLKDFVDGLDSIVPTSKIRKTRIMEQRIQNIRDEDALSLVVEATTYDYPEWSDAASVVLERQTNCDSVDQRIRNWIDDTEISKESADGTVAPATPTAPPLRLFFNRLKTAASSRRPSSKVVNPASDKRELVGNVGTSAQRTQAATKRTSPLPQTVSDRLVDDERRILLEQLESSNDKLAKLEREIERLTTVRSNESRGEVAQHPASLPPKVPDFSKSGWEITWEEAEAQVAKWPQYIRHDADIGVQNSGPLRPKESDLSQSNDYLLKDSDLQPLPPQPETPRSLLPMPIKTAANCARLVIAVDYGTTFTSLAFATTLSDVADLAILQVLHDWTTRMGNMQSVPSVISFATPIEGEANWGADIHEDAVTMVNTKLELEPQDSRLDELDLTLNLLKGTESLAFEHMTKVRLEPVYIWRTPTEIVTAYLGKVFECARKAIPDIEHLRITKTPVDVVITVPLGWSYEASDALFKAFRGAGFNKEALPTLNDTILVSEPEAALHFILRQLRERGDESLRVNDVVTLCNAETSAVEVVSYQITMLKPCVELRRVTEAGSDKHNAAAVDSAFKAWLRVVIGRTSYAEIDAANAQRARISPHSADSGPMRELMARFAERKMNFSSTNPSDIRIELPCPLDGLTIADRVDAGELTIHHHEMQQFLDPYVNSVIELILSQVEKVVYGEQRRVRHIFLVGCFGGLPYLQAELRSSLDRRGMRLHRPVGDQSRTAVVQGGVICGVEKARHKDARFLSAVTKSYAVALEGKFEWLIQKGDLVINNETRTIESSFFWHSTKGTKEHKYDFPVYYYLTYDPSDNDVPQFYESGIYDVDTAAVAKCDFLGHSPSPMPSNRDGENFIGPLKWRLHLTGASVKAEVFLKRQSVGSCEFKLDVDWPVDRSGSTDSWND